MDNFFYNMNQKLKDVLDAPKSEHKQLNEGAVAEASTGDYSAKKARAGKDIGKPGKAFAKIAKSAGEKYGSKERGEKVAGAVLAKLRGKNESAGDMEESAFQAAIGKKKYGEEGMKALQKAGREHASAKTMSNIRNKYDKYDESMEEGMFDSLKAGMAKAGSVAKKVAKKGIETLGHGSDEEMRKDLQRKMGLPPTGKKPVGEGDFGPMEGEGGVPMTPKQKKFAKLAPPADKITFADKIAGAKKEVDEMLGDVAAEAIKGALSPKQKKLDRNHNGKLDAQDFAMLRAGKGKQETDEGWDDMIKDVEKRRSGMKPGEKIQGHKGEIEKTATGIRHTRKYDPKTGETDTGDEAPSGEKRRGRPKGSKKSLGAKGPSGKSKLMTKEDGSYGQAQQIYNDLADIRAIAKQAQTQGQFPQGFASRLESTLWAAMTLIKNQQGGGAQVREEELDEKAVSKAQQKFMGMVHATQKGEKAPSKEVAKVAKGMKKKDAEDFAATKHKGLPEKVKSKKKDESAGEDKPKKVKEEGGTGTPTASSGFGYGKGIYDSINRELEAMISESMSINASDSTEGGKSLTITATDEDALKLGALLKSAGLGGEGMEHSHEGGEQAHEHGEEPCEVCGSADCGCGDIEEALDENQPDWPTDEVESDDAFQYSGGLNKPKSTGQTTVPVIAHQDSRMGVDGDEELRRMMEMAGLQSELEPWERTMKEDAEEELDEAAEEELDEAKTEELDESKCNECGMYEAQCKCDESVEESLARIRGLAGIQEAAKPDYIDLDKDGDKEESMKKAAADKAKGDKVDESIFKLTNLWKAYKG